MSRGTGRDDSLLYFAVITALDKTMRRLIPAIATLLFITACDKPVPGVMTVDQYKAQAMAAVDGVNAQDWEALVGDGSTLFIDVREGDELAEHGAIEGALHVPRGVLEFYIDPSSSLHMKEFASGKRLVFYCETGGRSLLAAKLAKDMGVADPVYLDGGFRAWQEVGGAIEK